MGRGRVVVTGGAGFIGSHVAEAFRAEGWAVAVADDLSRGRQSAVPPDAELWVVDVGTARFAELVAAFRPDVVVHLAAQVSVAASVEQPQEDARRNVLGTVAVARAAWQAGARRLVAASSAAVYGIPHRLPVPEEHPLQPLSPYGVSKLATEQYVRVLAEQAGREWCVLRYANVYGPRQRSEGEAGVVAVFARAALRGQSLPVHGDGGQTRDFVFVADVAEATLRAACVPRAAGQVFNVGTGRETAVLELARRLWAAAGRDGEVPLRFEPPRPGDVRRSVLDVGRAARELGWQARVELERGLVLTLADREAVGEG
ncbi:MAG TPA: NAD-dependent epimerase/dehydratase family protein [Limnochordales bacterium]